MKEINLQNLKHTLSDIHVNTENRKFCFVIGAGASYNSGIPTGGKLATKWFAEIKERYSSEAIKKWVKEVKLDTKDLAAHYGSIYRKRFETDKTSGYEFLVQAMRTAKPTFGHIVLAQILTKAPGNCILTTNFDSLIESSIYQYTDKTPLVCGHESLSGYATPSNIHPLIIKIHRDLLLSPKSDPDEINVLDKDWKEPLDNIFSTHIPIIIGYGGNDGSLMDYFEKMNKPSNFFWCGLKGTKPSNRVEKLVTKMEGSYIEIDGFDEMMHDLLWVFDEIKPIQEELDAITKDRIEAMDLQLKKMNSKSKALKDTTKEEKKELSAFEYSTKAQNEPDYERRKAIYLEALEKFPNTGWLWNTFIEFMYFDKKEYANMEEYFQKALIVDPDNSNINGNYANFLADIKKDFKNAEKHYLKVLALNPNRSRTNGNYANFLANQKGDLENAEKYFLKTFSINSEDPLDNGNYAGFLFLVNRKKEAKEYLEKAFELNKNNKIDLLIELWFYKYAHCQDSLKDAEQNIKELLKEGIRSIDINFNKHIEVAIKNGHPNAKKLKEFATKISKIEK